MTGLIAARPDAPDEFLDFRYQPRDDDVDAGAVWMDAIALVERRICRNAIEDERIEYDVMRSGERRKDRIEALGVVGAEIARCQHSGEQHRDFPLGQARDDAVEVLLRLAR